MKIGFVPSAPLLAPFARTILAFRKTLPGVRLVLEEQVTTAQIDALAERRLQIGFIRSPDKPALPDSIAALELTREPMVAFLRADHPLAKKRVVPLKALVDEPFVFFPRGIGTSLYDQAMALCRKAGFTPRIEQEARGNATILGLVAAGLGVAILPSSLQGIAGSNVASRPLSPKGTSSSMWLIHRKHDATPAAAKFVTLAAENARKRSP